ncbi:NitT/TauT family transport system permease protein/sulfonate transport system permease protein [Demequina lutea]|uniref:NitT/TauT family transport system permease protein/sulfonate transport system permease protein n=1 Tax=Demequina lutea TaxID=431489 RepID=A0A7Z0CJ46_9MICO|nr:NitT/TauT family transport system permease protein/sulfonate transport system permease protein [Demequina lutea]
MLTETLVTRPVRRADPTVSPPTTTSSSPRSTSSRSVARLAGTFGGGAILGIALLVAVWSFLYATRLFPDNLFPSVPAVWRAGVQMWQQGLLGPDITASIRETAVGFVIGTVLGIALALGTATTRTGRFILQPVLRLLAPIPTIGLIPLAILWFGIGDASKYVVVALGVFVPVWINAHAGLASTPADYLQVSGCLGSSRWLTLRKVILPEALPDIVAGMRVGCATAFVVIVVAEMTGTINGLGYRISQAQLFSQADRLIFLLAVLGVIGAICDQLIVNVARPFVAWAKEEN